MKNYCGKCGSPIDKNTGLCPNCDSDKMEKSKGKSSQNSSPRTTKSKKKKHGCLFPLLFLLLLLLAAFVLGILQYKGKVTIPYLGKLMSNIGLSQEMPGGFTIGEVETDTKVTDDASAISVAQEVAEQQGFKNAANELVVNYSMPYAGQTYYRMNQYYCGLPVVGRDIVVVVADDGTVLSSSNNLLDLEEGMDITPTVSQDRVENAVEDYWKSNKEMEEIGAIIVSKLSDKNLVIYALDMSISPELAYELEITGSDGGRFLAYVSAHTGEVISIDTLEESSVDPFIDEPNKINVHHHSDGDDVKDKVDGEKIFSLYKNIYTTYCNLIDLNKLFPDGSDLTYNADLHVLIPNKFGVGENGNAFSTILQGKEAQINIVYGASYPIDSDVLAHELTHSVTYRLIRWQYAGPNDQTHTINEAFADIMAEIIQAKMAGICDWLHTQGDYYNRSLKDPKDPKSTSPNNMMTISEWNSEPQQECHRGSTIISHAAYLMAAGIDGTYEKISIDELEKLWFSAMITFPSNCQFEDCRSCVLSAANNLKFSNEKRETVFEAFNRVGLTQSVGNSLCYSNSFSLAVYGKDGKRFSNYTAYINGVANTGENFERIIDNAGASENNEWINLVDGEYNITVAEMTTGKYYTHHFSVFSNGYKNQMSIFTDFTSTESGTNGQGVNPTANISIKDMSKRVVLVLDTSGSMSGDPIEKTKSATTRFADIALQQNAYLAVVGFESSAKEHVLFTRTPSVVKTDASSLTASGGTNIDDGLQKAEALLEKQTNVDKKIIVLMSDGQPNSGRVGDELIAYANELKNKGYTIFTVGFFGEAENKYNAQQLMGSIASEGFHYEVSKDSDELENFFSDMASQINGEKDMYVRVACPVDVKVTYNGETLDSTRDGATRTSFGSLTFEETSDEQVADNDDRTKILRLKSGVDYDIVIAGNGTGRMDYTIGFMDDAGEYSDMRRINNVKITRDTLINTVATEAEETTMDVDEDGDGKIDYSYRVTENGYGEQFQKSMISGDVMVIIVLATLIILALSLLIIVLKRRQKS